MALIDDLTITLSIRRLVVGATLGTFYESRDLYSLLQNLVDETGVIALPGSMGYPTPMSGQTPTDFTLKSGWYLTQQSYRRLKGGSIQTFGSDGEIYKLSFASSGYTNAVSGDIGKTVTNGSGVTGILLDYDNTSRWWRIRKVSGTFSNSNSITITTGTGAGTLLSSGAVATGEEGHASAYTIGSVLYDGTYIAQNGSVLDTSDWFADGNSGSSNEHVDVLIKIKETGALIDSGKVTFYNRNNRTAGGGTTGSTYDWFEADLSGFGRTPVPLNTRADIDDTLTDSAIADYLNGTTATIAFATGTYNVDVDQDGSTETYSGQIDANGQSLAIVWQAIKYYFRKGATTSISGTQAQQFRYLNSGYTVIKDSPVASFAGGKLFLARGWVIVNVAAADASNYETVDNGGTRRVPPQFRLRAVTGLSSGYKVLLTRRSALSQALIAEFTLASGNNSGNSTLAVSSSIPSDKPSSGYVRVLDNSGNEDRYAYTSFSGSTFTLSGTLSKTYASGNSAYVPYIDATASGSSVSASLRYVADRDVVLNVRLGSGAGKIQPFESNFTLEDADSSVPATAIADSINNN